MVLEMRRAHSYWGARRIVFELARKRVEPAPSESAVYRCLVRAAVIDLCGSKITSDLADQALPVWEGTSAGPDRISRRGVRFAGLFAAAWASWRAGDQPREPGQIAGRGPGAATHLRKSDANLTVRVLSPGATLSPSLEVDSCL